MVVVGAIAWLVLRITFYGRDVYAAGGNPRASWRSGVSVRRTIIAVYGISGLTAAIGAVIETGQLGSAAPVVSSNIALSAAAAVLLGGTSFSGGVGGVVGTAVGVLFIGVLQNGLELAGISSFWQEVVTGVVLVAAVLIDRARTGAWPLLRGLGSGRLARDEPLETGSALGTGNGH
jgi:ribose/xylose/arabinose/galactoside ABC-type transport system permease subunit